MKPVWMTAKKPPRLWNPPRFLDGDGWTPLGQQRVCNNKGCLIHTTNKRVCECEVPTQPLGGDVCEPSNGNGSGSNGKARTRKKSRS